MPCEFGIFENAGLNHAWGSRGGILGSRYQFFAVLCVILRFRIGKKKRRKPCRYVVCGVLWCLAKFDRGAGAGIEPARLSARDFESCIYY
jgi:hypothetical protein